MIIVTSYRNPDLDGVACSIAYAELQKSLGKKAKATYYGTLGLEVNFIKGYCQALPAEKNDGDYQQDDLFILVDTADPGAIDPNILVEKVIELFDHRELVFIEKFVNAKKTIEKVGSCATLITQQFQKHNLKPSKVAATYLYGAIISNTINFKNAVTTQKDKSAAEWLKSLVKPPDDFIQKMFLSKSNVTKSNLYETILQDFSVKMVGKSKVGIAQIEIANLEEILNETRPDLSETLKRLKEEKDLDYILFTGVDILKGFNIFITIDEESRKLFSKALAISDFPPEKKVDFIMMRKQIWPKLESILNKK